MYGVWILSLVLFTSGAKELPIEFDLIEVNHMHDETGRHMFDQAILWKKSHDYRRHDAAGWAMLQKLDHYPKKRQDGKYYLRVERDHKQYLCRARMLIETWSTADPERENRNLFPENLRYTLWPSFKKREEVKVDPIGLFHP